MRCYICDKDIPDEESRLDKYGRALPCTGCLAVVVKTKQDDNELVETKEMFDDMEIFEAWLEATTDDEDYIDQ